MAFDRRTRRPWLVLLPISLAACSSDSCGSAPNLSALPVAIACAGPDQQVRTGTVAALDGGCSRLTEEAFDSEFLAVHWELWSKPAGSQAFLSARDTPWPSFTADLDGLYVVVLQAWASTRQDLATEDRVTVTARSGNSPPVAVTLPTWIRGKVGELVALDGSASHDADGDALTYRWAFVEPSADSLDDETSARPRFLAQAASSQVVGLAVSDGITESETSRCVVEVTPLSENAPPLVDAGPDQGVRPGAAAALDGSGSRDPDGDPLTYRWRLLWRPPGSTASIASPEAAQTPFTPDVEGRYLVLLSVSDGRSSPPANPQDYLDSCVVLASNGNLPPVARASGPPATTAGETVALDGNGSSDPDGDPLAYRWTLLSAPSGSTASPSPSSAPACSFTADLPGTYVARLVVDDGAATHADRVTIRATAPGTNRPPVANAGADQPGAVAGAPVSLDGSGSFDPDGDPITFLWSITSAPAGSVAALGGAATASASFTPDVAGTYVLRLEVSDGLLADADTVVVEARGNRPPVADAGPDPDPVIVGNPVTLDGSGSFDPDGDAITFLWSITSAPAGSVAVIGASTTAHPTLTPDRDGTFVLWLTVSDGSLSDLDAVTVVARDASVNRPPLADAGPDRSTVVGVPATLDGSGSSDPDGDPISFQWTLVQRPAGSGAALLGDTTSAPSLTPDVAGEYAARLVVSDGTLSSAPDVALVTASPAATPLPVETQLPFQGGIEEPVFLVVGAGDPETLRVVSSSSPDAYSERSALSIGPWSGPQAAFSAMWAWTMASRSHPDPVDDSATPRLVLRRTSDGVHFAVVVDFTVGSYTVRIDGLQAWRCAAGPETCP